MTFDFLLQNGILAAIWRRKKFSIIAIFLGRNGHLRKNINDVT